MENSKTISVSFKGKTAQLQQLPNGKWVCTNIGEFTKLGSSITWLDDCRVPTTEAMKETTYPAGRAMNPGGGKRNTPEVKIVPHEGGRFPANLLVSDDVLNDGVERKGSSTTKVGKVYGEERGTSYLQQKAHGVNINDSGSYSRYFDLDAWAKTLPFLIVPKASKREKNEGLTIDNKTSREALMASMPLNGDGTPRNKQPQANFHPTVKPLKLMSYLITLGSRPGDVVLDPFLGSGTTAVAAKQLGRQYIGIERESEYVAIARARIETATAPEPKLFEEA